MYRVHIRRRIANFGVAVIARDRGVAVEPRVVRTGDENRLAGYTALPFDQNPYRPGYGRHRLVAGVALPGPGVYDIVFDTPTRRAVRWHSAFGSGRETFGLRRSECSAFGTDSSSWRSETAAPESTRCRFRRASTATSSPCSFASGRARLSLAGDARGRHTLSFTASDYQETKNMENVARILPNTRTVRTTFVRP